MHLQILHTEGDVMINQMVSSQVQEVQEEEGKEEPQGVQWLQQWRVGGGRGGGRSQQRDVGGENLHRRTPGGTRSSAHPHVPGRQAFGVSWSVILVTLLVHLFQFWN